VGGEALVKIVRANPEARDECVGVLTQQLEQFTKNSSELNGFLIADLLDLKAVESAPIMEQAFAAKRVDTSIAGGWLDVQIDLGLKTYSEVREIRRTVDAEHLGSKAAKRSRSHCLLVQP
jgi:hypothetical protein